MFLRNALFSMVVMLLILVGANAQTSAQPSFTVNGRSFIDYQKSFKRPQESSFKKEEYLKKLFEIKGLAWPAKYLYIRSFKYDSQLEVWAKNTAEEPYKLFKIYKVCALVGTMGPKRFEGDYQVPEGFYYINEFNPNSAYYLSMGLNYPNASDKILSDQVKPGGDIYIHGGCSTVGCIPVKDDQIAELYVLCANAKSAGLDFIPVHIFPVHYNVKRSYEYMNKTIGDDAALRKFSNQLEQAYDYFEKYQQIPLIFTKDNGEYHINDALPLEKKFIPIPKPKAVANTSPVRTIDNIPPVVNQWPEFVGGAAAYEKYIQKVANDVARFLPEENNRVNVLVEFVIDKDGAPVNFKILQGVEEHFDSQLINELGKMPSWKPATLQKKPVAKRMIQSISIGE